MRTILGVLAGMLLLAGCSDPNKELSPYRSRLDTHAGLCESIKTLEILRASAGAGGNVERYSQCLKDLSAVEAEHTKACKKFFDDYTCQREQEDIIRRAQDKR